MIILEAPYELPALGIVLPSPAFNNTLGILTDINKLTSINNQIYTYIKNKNRKKMNYTFLLKLEKIFELQDFIELYLTSYIKMTNHNNEIYKIRLVSDPFSFGYKTIDNEAEILISFEGVRIYVPTINC